MAKKSDSLMWFRVYATGREALEEIPDQNLGKALKAAMRYFAANGNAAEIEKIENDIAAENDKLTLIAFKALKTGIDDSLMRMNCLEQAGKKAQQKRKKRRQRKRPRLKNTEPQNQSRSLFHTGKTARGLKGA